MCCLKWHFIHGSEFCILEVVDILKVKIVVILENDFETSVRSCKENNYL